jgi:enamine deaminase RidA (YjgF/YER057c/UK114 family)
MSAESQLAALGLTLPPAPKAIGVYKSVVTVGDLIYTSGHGPLQSDKTLITGRVGDELTTEEGYAAARQTGLALLATLKETLGSLDKIERVVKVLGMVHATPDYKDHPAVINGCSELFSEVFGSEAGVAARSAVGVASLPAGMSVEIEAIFQVKG